MSNNRVEEIKKEDKKAFKSFAIMMVISAIVGAIIGSGSIYLQEHMGNNLSDFLLNALMMITPYASLVLSILVIVVSVVIYSNSRKKLKLWNQSDEQEEIIDNIEEKLSYVLLFASVNLIIGFFFFGAGMGLFSEDSYGKVILFFFGFIVCVVSTVLIQNKVVNLEKEINPFLNGSVYDFKFSQKWLDSCDEAIKLNVYKSSFKAHKSVTNTCLILWIVCVLGYSFFDFGIMPLVMVTIIWLVQTVSYCIESIKCSKNKIN
ncbi:DUF3169 family protein [Intestinibacter bartlettii]|uniref:DUF3169 family protein n=1 Tax=Intestinibacter bartlettii TaxID=261299 RepID=A0ABS6DVU9_9FIRM|nr:DUF3169 family protein [Intestinibacter bartlettii]MBU5335568.1 DUF3169 family protein [Intestinibacter bartlettii]